MRGYREVCKEQSVPDDFSLFDNLIRQKFSSNGSNHLIVLGDKSAQTNACFHVPTQGVRLRCQLHRLESHILLSNEYRHLHHVQTVKEIQ
jgi:hypothetical protein